MKSEAMMEDDPILRRIVPTLSQVKGVAGIMLGGSRGRGTAHSESDYDIGLYFATEEVLDTDRLSAAVTTLVDDPLRAHVTPVGGWGPWIVGGGWLSVDGKKVDLLYRNIEAVAEVIEACGAGNISMHYQPGHPHGFCSATWMGEVALGLPLHDPARCLARLKARSSPYPAALRRALIRKFQWEILFSIENAEIAVPRGEETHIAGCVYRALACLAQVLFALNERHLINEKGALQEAAMLPLTIADLSKRAANVWQLIGGKSFSPALSILRMLEQELTAMSPLSRVNEA
jgi:predicted nucleotidyltransferase